MPWIIGAILLFDYCLTVNHILIISHTPLASALKSCVQHVYAACDSDCIASVSALDIAANLPNEALLIQASELLAAHRFTGLLILTDILGASPCNMVQKNLNALSDQPMRVITGVNLPMLLRAINYRHESLDNLAEKALAGGTQGVQLLQAHPHDTEKTKP